MAGDPWREGLNTAQLEAVTHDAGPLLVVAGAGTGKTRTLAARVARLLADGADPDHVLLLTFSRRAAREMLARAEQLGTARASAGVWGGTFHAVANRLLREHGHAVGLPARLSILDQADAADLFGVVRSELGFAERGRRFPKKETLADVYSRVANAQEPLREVLRERFPWCEADADDVAAVFSCYAERKRARGLLDDAHTFSQPSRFLADTKALFDRPAVEHTVALDAGSALPPGPDPVAAQLSSLWS